MKKHDESRRAFILGAAVGAGAVAGGALIATALPGGNDAATAPADEHMHGDGGTLGAYLNAAEGATVTAFAERLMPGAPGNPGATDAGVRNYIDLALAGAYSSQQDFYRRGLRQLDAFANEKFGAAFVALNPAKQDEVITSLEEGIATGFAFPRAGSTKLNKAISGVFA